MFEPTVELLPRLAASHDRHEERSGAGDDAYAERDRDRLPACELHPAMIAPGPAVRDPCEVRRPQTANRTPRGATTSRSGADMGTGGDRWPTARVIHTREVPGSNPGASTSRFARFALAGALRARATRCA